MTTESKLSENFKKVRVPAPGSVDTDTSSMRNYDSQGNFVGPTVEIEVPVAKQPEQKPYDIDTSSMRGFTRFQP